MFNHQMYQQGSGIDFTIARYLRFHQTTGFLNAEHYKRKRAAEPVIIPKELLAPFTLDEYEQAFSIRAYRHSRLTTYLTALSPSFFDAIRWGTRDTHWDASHLPLFKTIVAEDSHLNVLHVKGKEIAHFATRKNAVHLPMPLFA